MFTSALDAYDLGVFCERRPKLEGDTVAAAAGRGLVIVAIGDLKGVIPNLRAMPTILRPSDAILEGC